LVRLEFALTQFVLDEARQAGFEPMQVPHMVSSKVAAGSGYLPRGEERQIYKKQDEDLNLIATSEMPITGYHTDEILDLSHGPLRYAGYSACYRLEAGAYGKHSRGLYRVHQFNKVELYAFAKPEESETIHQSMMDLEESICQKLGLPYQVVRIAAGDLGAPAYKKYDIEYWTPVDDSYRELTSCSNITTYQARRLGIRYRKDDGSIDYAHTLNGTAIATGRGLIAILENYQTKDGKVRVPEVLQRYIGVDVL
jgi:seryl-tRNA synthetase